MRRGGGQGAGPKQLGGLLTSVLDKHGLREQVERMEVIGLWPEIVGERLADVTKAKGVSDGALFVEVRNSAWLTELSMMKGDFLERVNARLPETPMEKIVFVLAETT